MYAGYLSWRSHVWTDVDNNRCGTLPFVFDDDFGFDRYVEYALDVPMYFVYRCAAVQAMHWHPSRANCFVIGIRLMKATARIPTLLQLVGCVVMQDSMYIQILSASLASCTHQPC